MENILYGLIKLALILIGIGAMGEILSMILYDSFAEYRRRSCAASSLATVGALIGLASSIILVISGKIN